jgi:hypothetical protein
MDVDDLIVNCRQAFLLTWMLPALIFSNDGRFGVVDVVRRWLEMNITIAREADICTKHGIFFFLFRDLNVARSP